MEETIDKGIYKIQTLLEHNRFKEAEKEIEEQLAIYPNFSILQMYYAETLLQLDKFERCEEVTKQALGNHADNTQLMYILSRCYVSTDRYDDALVEIDRAIENEPEGADYHAFKGQIFLLKKEFKKALEEANIALSLDAQITLALTVKSTASIKLGLEDEMQQSIEDNLYFNPEDANSHAMAAYNLLEAKKYKEALKHAEEAMAIDPNNEMAQYVILEALKCRHLPYKLFFQYMMWMSNMTGGKQWGFIIGFYVLTQLLDEQAQNYPQLSYIIGPLSWILVLFALSTWVMEPLSNAMLLLNKYGKFLLKEEAKKSARLVLVCIGIGISLILGGNIIDINYLITAGIVSVAMMIPFSKFMDLKSDVLYVAGLIITIIMGIYVTFTSFVSGYTFTTHFQYFSFSILGMQFLINYLMTKK